MPSILAKELRALAKEKHYLDVSELVRTIVRTKAIQYASPQAREARKIINDIERELGTRSKANDEQALLAGLRQLLEDYRK
jgi:Arc/MetJ-type ribon-helix-helix transcriptional regulator